VARYLPSTVASETGGQMRAVVYYCVRKSEGPTPRCRNIATIIFSRIRKTAMRKPANEEGLLYLENKQPLSLQIPPTLLNIYLFIYLMRKATKFRTFCFICETLTNTRTDEGWRAETRVRNKKKLVADGSVNCSLIFRWCASSVSNSRPSMFYDARLFSRIILNVRPQTSKF
jgi:hypothetical protein